MAEKDYPIHLNSIHIKTMDLKESGEFYDLLFKYIGLNKKDIKDDALYFWGPFGVIISEQKRFMSHVDYHHRLGVIQLGIRVGSKQAVDEIYAAFSRENYTFHWEPTKFDYTDHYYSTCIFDPDDNRIEIVYDL